MPIPPVPYIVIQSLEGKKKNESVSAMLACLKALRKTEELWEAEEGMWGMGVDSGFLREVKGRLKAIVGSYSTIHTKYI